MHAIAGLFREVLPCLDLPEEVRTHWEKVCDAIMVKGLQIGYGQSELVRLLDACSIQYAILKGTSAAQYYPNGFSRALGDIDFIVEEKDYERTMQILQQNGYVNAHEHEDNYRHESFIKDELHYECHHLFADRSFSHAAKIDELIAKNIEHAELPKTEYGSFRSLPTSINGLVLLEHIAIHIKSGLGLRQIVDWILYVRENLGDEEWHAENGQVIRDSGLETLAKVVTRVGQLYFGLRQDINWCCDADENVCRNFIELVFSYGNFGSKTTIDDKIISVAQRYRRNSFENLRFSGEHNWKLLHKYPWLKPLAPVYQIGRYTKIVISTKGALKALLFKGKAVTNRDLLMKELGI